MQTDAVPIPRRSATIFMWCLAATPAAWLLLFGLLLVRARVALGRWPQPYQPDPKDLPFDIHYTVTIAGVPLVWAAVLSVTALTLLNGRRGERRWPIPLVALAGLAALIVLARIDPGGTFTWLGD